MVADTNVVITERDRYRESPVVLLGFCKAFFTSSAFQIFGGRVCIVRIGGFLHFGCPCLPTLHRTIRFKPGIFHSSSLVFVMGCAPGSHAHNIMQAVNPAGFMGLILGQGGTPGNKKSDF